ncbi:MAG: 3-hydroxyacyl-[acyl-carrier-protein] dehydratase FabZ [Candidatus Sericytochromatia bacterium]|nr:MAG: 3-hydroxyacyl-[acyl-carrier-protein] dehydratase FabZ [Candidatus Sericytochromatia bacterium]
MIYKKYYPHRYPFLFIDRVIDFIPEKKAIAEKFVSENENYFQGHFPNKPIMPGVLIIEAMAQTGGIIILSMEFSKNKLAVLAGLNNFKFRNIVLPNQTLKMIAETLSIRKNFGKINTCAYVDNKLVCEGEILFALIDK